MHDFVNHSVYETEANIFLIDDSKIIGLKFAH